MTDSSWERPTDCENRVAVFVGILMLLCCSLSPNINNALEQQNNIKVFTLYSFFYLSILKACMDILYIDFSYTSHR